MHQGATMSATNIVWHSPIVTKESRSTLKKQHPFIVWFTGYSGSGKSTIANAVEQRLSELNLHTYLLDGDNVRNGLNKDLGFNDADRKENIRRIGEVAKLFVDAGLIVITAFISPFKHERETVRELVNKGEFFEVYMNTPLTTCEERDSKGLYKKARAGDIKEFTGIDSHYESPINPEITLDTSVMNEEQCVHRVLQHLQRAGKLPELTQ